MTGCAPGEKMVLVDAGGRRCVNERAFTPASVASASVDQVRGAATEISPATAWRTRSLHTRCSAAALGEAAKMAQPAWRPDDRPPAGDHRRCSRRASPPAIGG